MPDKLTDATLTDILARERRKHWTNPPPARTGDLIPDSMDAGDLIERPASIVKELLENSVGADDIPFGQDTGPVRIGALIPEAIAEIIGRRNRGVQRRISGSSRQSRQRQYGGAG